VAVAVGARVAVAVGAPTTVGLYEDVAVGWMPPPPPPPGPPSPPPVPPPPEPEVWLPVVEVPCAWLTFVRVPLPVAPAETRELNFAITADIGLLGIARAAATHATSSTNVADTNASDRFR
jgi:hypothetical protein